ncbi:MAG: hypothetical protein ACSLFD_07315 [Solirubrobacterales bacterium]
MRKLLVTTALMLVAGMAVSTAAQAAPNRVRIASEDGKARLKVQKKIPVLISCSKNCGGRVKMTLVAPATTDSAQGKFTIKAGNVLTLRFKLTNFGVRYIRKNVARSKLKVRFSSVDFATGKRTIKRRTFGFYK